MSHGFELLREETVREINAKAYLYRHVRTGAEFLSVVNDDENKTFCIAFKTPPADATGLPHIMEHSVLCGSRKYPLKEPFVELLKSSLATFVNASTYPDKTIYPVASANLQDYYNLVDVYLDAVFYPRLTPRTLAQEGWHYELDDASGEMIFKGVVFNEMKGVYSSGDSMASKWTLEALLPDTPYGVDSGGDPKIIPDLTWEQFKRFHERYYHPSNARIWMYGDDDPAKRLELLESWLSAFDAAPIDTTIALQPAFPSPRRLVVGYDAGDAAETEARAFVTVNWLVGRGIDTEAVMALNLLEYILVDTPASPLRRALLESGLGEDLTGTGALDGIQQTLFGTGLKNARASDANAIESLVLTTLERLSVEGIDRGMIEAALNTFEFRLREMNTGRLPRGLALAVRSLNTWLYGGDPLDPIRYEAPLNAIKAAIARGERFFENLIRRHLLDNPHRVTLQLQPDPTLRARENASEKDRLAKAREALSPPEVDAVVAETKTLKALQAQPDPPEALATLPTLKVSDLDRRIKTVPGELSEAAGATVFHHDLFTNGVLYADLAFDTSALPPEDVPFLALLGRALLEMGAGDEDYVALAQRVRRLTGGVNTMGFHGMPLAGGRGVSRFIVRGKATPERAGALFDILRDALLRSRTDDRERFRQIVLEEKAGAEGSLLPAGHSYAVNRLSAQFSPADWIAEQTGGLTSLFFLRELASQIDTDWPSVKARLESVKSAVLQRHALIANITIDGTTWAGLRPTVEAFLRDLPDGAGLRPRPRYVLPRGNEGFSLPSQVNYVAKAASLYEHGYRRHGSALVAGKYLRTTLLWERVRVMGGAYGGFCRFDPMSGIFAFVSYRDPNLLGTLAHYDAAGTFLRSSDISGSEVQRTIIGVIGELDTYLLPDAKGLTALQRHLLGQTPDYRQQIRDEVMATTRRDLAAFGDALDAAVRDHGSVVVLGGPGALEAANVERGRFLHVDRIL